MKDLEENTKEAIFTEYILHARFCVRNFHTVCNTSLDLAWEKGNTKECTGFNNS